MQTLAILGLESFAVVVSIFRKNPKVLHVEKRLSLEKKWIGREGKLTQIGAIVDSASTLNLDAHLNIRIGNLLMNN